METVPWWEETPKGRVIPLAFVKIDLAGGEAEWPELAPEQVAERRQRYRAGVESIARAHSAAQPLSWHGDGVMLFLADGEGERAPVRAVRAAKLLWERARVDLSIPARIAVHAAHVAWDPDTGTLTHPALGGCGHLEEAAPGNALVISGDVYFALPESDKGTFAPLGITSRDGLPAFVFPAKAAERKPEGAFRDEADLALWEHFRRYAEGPEIRLLRYVGLRLTKREPPALRIEDVFVSLEVQGQTRPILARLEAKRTEAARHQAQAGGERELEFQLPPFERGEGDGAPAAPQPFREVFSRSRAVVVLGDPGSGKTTLLRWLAVVAAGGRLALARELGVDQWLLPLPVSVGTLAALRVDLGAGASVIDALARYFHARNVGEEEQQLRAFLTRRLTDGEGLVLLDGLDEVRSAQEREEVCAWLETFAALYPRNRLVVTSRHVGYPGFAVPDAVVSLRPFDDEQVRRYVVAFTRAYRFWESGVPADPAAKIEAEQLLAALRASPRLTALARNPFMLSALALIHRAEGRLPRHRVQFYAIFAQALCESWGRARRLVVGAPEPERVIEFEEEAIPILGDLARRMLDSYPAGAAPTDFVLVTLANALAQRRRMPPEEARRAAAQFLERAGAETQILLERGPGLWGFLHLTFQEFFVAVGLHAAEAFEQEALEYLYDPRWEEIIRLGVGYLALVQSRPKAAQDFVERVLAWKDTGPDAEVHALLRKHVPLAALLAAEASDSLPVELQRTVAADFARWVLDMPASITSRYVAELALTDCAQAVEEPLLEGLGDPQPHVRARAAEGLGILRAQSATTKLTEMGQDPNPEVRAAAAGALGTVRAESAIPMLIEMVCDSDYRVRVRASDALRTLGANAGVPALLGILRDPDDLKRARAAAALGALGAEAAIPALIELLRDAVPSVRLAAAGALGNLRAESVAPALIQMLKDPDPDARARAAEVLGKLRAEAAAPALIRMLDDPYDWVRAGAADALGELQADAAIPALTKMLDDPDGWMRGHAAAALGQLRAEAAIPRLVGAVHDPDWYVRMCAVRALGKIEAESAIPGLIDALQDPDPRVRCWAAVGLGELRPESAIRTLVDALQEPEPGVRSLAAAELGHLGAESAIPALVDALPDPDPHVQAWAATALGHLRAESAIPALLKSASTWQGEDRDNAVEALWRIAEGLATASGDQRGGRPARRQGR